MRPCGLLVPSVGPRKSSHDREPYVAQAPKAGMSPWRTPDKWSGVRCPRASLKLVYHFYMPGSDHRALHYELRSELHKSFSHKLCLAPNEMKPSCSGPIVAAHSVQRNGYGLCMIAEAGHVLALTPDRTGEPKMVKIGVRNASTFTGFCGYHDTTIFAPIERSEFELEPEQVFLHLYRSFCREPDSSAR